MLPLSVTPGRRAPPDLDSYLLPFINELQELGTGVPAYDSLTKSRFRLKAHLVLTTGDSPAISKIYHLSGHNAIYPCRLCLLKGFPYGISYTTTRVQNGERMEIQRTKQQYYYPMMPPNLPRGDIRLRTCGPRYLNVASIPLRTHQGYLRDGRASLNRTAEPSSTGVKGLSSFTLPEFNLGTISFPESCPFDLMHLLHLGFGSDICALLSGTYFKDPTLNGEMRGRMSSQQWDQFGMNLETAKVPTSWGRIPQHIRYIKGYKAEDFSNLLTYYILPLSFNRVDNATYRALQRLVLVKILAESYQISDQDLAEIELNLNKFTKWFYDTYYGRKYDRLPVCKYTMHGLSHLVQSLKSWGPACYTWQYPMVTNSIIYV